MNWLTLNSDVWEVCVYFFFITNSKTFNWCQSNCCIEQCVRTFYWIFATIIKIRASLVPFSTKSLHFSLSFTFLAFVRSHSTSFFIQWATIEGNEILSVIFYRAVLAVVAVSSSSFIFFIADVVVVAFLPFNDFSFFSIVLTDEWSVEYSMDDLWWCLRVSFWIFFSLFVRQKSTFTFILNRCVLYVCKTALHSLNIGFSFFFLPQSRTWDDTSLCCWKSTFFFISSFFMSLERNGDGASPVQLNSFALWKVKIWISMCRLNIFFFFLFFSSLEVTKELPFFSATTPLRRMKLKMCVYKCSNWCHWTFSVVYLFHASVKFDCSPCDARQVFDMQKKTHKKLERNMILSLSELVLVRFEVNAIHFEPNFTHNLFNSSKIDLLVHTSIGINKNCSILLIKTRKKCSKIRLHFQSAPLVDYSLCIDRSSSNDWE